MENFVTGLAGVVLIIFSLFGGSAEAYTEGINYWPVLLTCIAVFFIVFLPTSIFLKRPFTSELPLLLIWGGIEAPALITAGYLEFFSLTPLIICTALNTLAAITGLACYAVFYRLEGTARFIDGLIPYAAITFSMTVTAVFLVAGV
ncbi:MAG: hypothetical protein JW969_21370 [Spirochaetales bacterium]|nr:hypothetical protein [Spirochaetales bacterium]